MRQSGWSMSFQSYVLRLWSEEQNGRSVWRFTLLEPQTGKRLSFDSLTALFAHLDLLTENGAASE